MHIIIWATVTAERRYSLVFIDKGVEVDQKIYL